MRARRRGVGTFFLGFFIGIIFIVAAVGGVVLWALYGLNVKTIEDWIGRDLVKDEEVETKNLLDLFQWAQKFAGDENNLTITKFNDLFAFEIPLNINGLDISAIKDVPLTKLSQNVNLILDAVTLETLSGFGVTLPDLPILTNNKTKPVLKLFDVIQNSISGDAVSMATLSENFGITLPDHPVIASMREIPLAELDSKLDGVVLDMTIGEVIGGEQTGLLLALKDVKIKDLNATVPTLKLGQVMPLTESSGVLFKLKDTPINEMDSAIKSLQLKDLIDLDEATAPKLLLALQNSTMDTLETDINKLTILDILTRTDEASFSNMLLDKQGGAKFIDIGSAVNNMIKTLKVRELAECTGTTLKSNPLYELTVPEFFEQIDNHLPQLP